MISIGAKIKQIHGLLGTKDVNAWETDFIGSVWAWSKEGADTRGTSEKQIEVIERIWKKHFAGDGA